MRYVVPTSEVATTSDVSPVKSALETKVKETSTANNRLRLAIWYTDMVL